MWSELTIAANPFLRLHRRWLCIFFGLEILYLLAAITALEGFDQFWHLNYRQPFLVWIYTIPPLVFQIVLGIHLGIALSLKNPAAWEMRLPYSRRAACWFSCALILINACALYSPVFRMWAISMESMMYPASLALVFSPCLALQLARRQPTPVAATAVAVAATSAISLLIAGFALNSISGHKWYLNKMDPVEIEFLVLGISLVSVIIADPARKTFSRATALVIGACTLILVNVEIREHLYRDTDHYQILTKWRIAQEELACDCTSFASEAYELRSDKKSIELGRLATREEVLRAVSLLHKFQHHPYSPEEIKQLWKAAPDQPSFRTAMILLNGINPTSGGRFELINLFSLMIPGIVRTPGFTNAERARMLQETVNFTSTFIANSWGLMDTLVSYRLVSALIEASSQDQAIEDGLRVVFRKLEESREEIDRTLSKQVGEVLIPSNERLRSEIQIITTIAIPKTDMILKQLADLTAKTRSRLAS